MASNKWESASLNTDYKPQTTNLPVMNIEGVAVNSKW